MSDQEVIRLTRVGWGAWMWEIPIPDSFLVLTIEWVYFTRRGAERAARRAWRRGQSGRTTYEIPLDVEVVER